MQIKDMEDVRALLENEFDKSNESLYTIQAKTGLSRETIRRNLKEGIIKTEHLLKLLAFFGYSIEIYKIDMKEHAGDIEKALVDALKED